MKSILLIAACPGAAFVTMTCNSYAQELTGPPADPQQKFSRAPAYRVRGSQRPSLWHVIADLIDGLATALTVALGGLAVSASPRRVPPSAGSPFCERTQFCISKGLVGEIKEKRHFRSRKATVEATRLLRLSGAALVSVV